MYTQRDQKLLKNFAFEFLYPNIFTILFFLSYSIIDESCKFLSIEIVVISMQMLLQKGFVPLFILVHSLNQNLCNMLHL